MPAWLWITAATAVAFVLWVAFGRRWWHAWLYDWRHAQHVVELSRAKYDDPAGYGSMIYAEDPHGPEIAAMVRAYGDISGPPDGLSWREQTAIGLSPETLDAEIQEAMERTFDAAIDAGWLSAPPEDPGGGPTVSGPEGAEGVNAPSVQQGTGPGDTVSSSLASPGPGQPSRWLTEQLEVLHAWSEWQQQKAGILS